MKISAQEGMVPGKTLAEKLDNLEKYGYEGIEFGGGGLEARQDEIIKAVSQSKVKPSSICAGYRGCLLDPSKEQRDLAMFDMKKLLTVAGNIGAVGLIMVPIFGGPRIPDLLPYKSVRELQMELLVTLLKELGDYAKEAGSIVLVEPLNRYETHFINRLEQGVEVCKKVNSPNVKIMADFFHMSIEERSIPKSIEEAGEYIYHMHLADSTRLLPGYGHTDFKTAFDSLKKVGFDKYMAMECGIPGDSAVELPKSANYLKQWI